MQTSINQKGIEKRALIVSSIVNLIMAGAGIWVFIATKIQALFLDGFFSLIGFTSTLFAVIISSKSKKTTKLYPDGIYFLEPLYAILKSLLTLALLIMSVVGTSMTAYDYFAKGEGIPMNIAPVLPYTICMVVLCFGLFIFNKLQNKKIHNTSTILSAEAKSNFVDGLLSAGVGIGILFLYIVDINGALGFLHYTGDFFITVILVLLSLKQPIQVLFNSFKELSGATISNKEILNVVNSVIKKHIGEIIEFSACNVFKVGMHIKIRIKLHKKKIDDEILDKLYIAKENAINELKLIYESIELNYML